MTSREVIKILREDGWYKVDQDGSHAQFEHPSKKGKVTIPVHAGRDIPKKTLLSIFKQAQISQK